MDTFSRRRVARRFREILRYEQVAEQQQQQCLIELQIAARYLRTTPSQCFRTRVESSQHEILTTTTTTNHRQKQSSIKLKTKTKMMPNCKQESTTSHPCDTELSRRRHKSRPRPQTSLKISPSSSSSSLAPQYNDFNARPWSRPWSPIASIVLAALIVTVIPCQLQLMPTLAHAQHQPATLAESAAPPPPPAPQSISEYRLASDGGEPVAGGPLGGAISGAANGGGGEFLIVAENAQRLARHEAPGAGSAAADTLELLQQNNLDTDAGDLLLLFAGQGAAQQVAYDYHANMPIITKRELGQAIKQATATVDKQMLDAASGQPPGGGGGGGGAPSSSTGWPASSMFHKQTPMYDPRVLNQTRQALISEETARQLARQYKLSRQQILRGLPLISLEQTSLGKQCPRSSRAHNCLPGRYRSYSGHCNNVQNPDWAAAQTPLVRYAPPNYADSIAKPARAALGPLAPTDRAPLGQSRAPLPSARDISIAIHSSTTSDATTPTAPHQQQHSHMTTMLSFFGQFVFHDLALISQFNAGQLTPIKCCQQAAATRHSECMPIEFKRSGANQEPYCLDYVRSTPAVRSGCNLGHRDQLNLVSSYLDGSVIYGSSEAQARSLRTFTGGRLRSQRVPATSAGAIVELLPDLVGGGGGGGGGGQQQQQLSLNDSHWAQAASECHQMALMRHRSGPNNNNNKHESSCFQAGDVRANQNIGLTLVHTIWLREHNRIADKLSQLNKHWRDERLFDETRRIVVAQLQHITYGEFLPSIVGEQIMQQFNLSTQNQGYSQNYDPQLNAGASNELASAVLPFILSTIPATLERYSERLEMLGTTNLLDTFMDGSDLFRRNKLAQYLTGMMSQSAMEPVLGLVPMMMTTAAAAPNGNQQQQRQRASQSEPPVVDAVALTIQQGRDHGLKPYVYWRLACQLRPAVRKWQDLYQVMPAATVDKLRQVYASVDQLDLYVGLLETPAPGATVGPTFVCLLARQFYHLKHGDRFWFENDLPDLAFTPKQLDEIRQTSLAKIMCRNSQASISFIQPAPMLSSDPYLNAYQYCTNKAMDELDLTKWRQPVQSAQQLLDEQMLHDLDGLANGPGALARGPRSLVRGKRLIEAHSELIVEELSKAKANLDLVAQQEAAKLRAASTKTRARRQANGAPASGRHAHRGHGNYAAGYRYLPRIKRQALRLNNQSIIFELATNEVVRSFLRSGKDREQATNTQNDIQDFLYSLETIQLNNLLDNSASSGRVKEFIATAGSNFLTDEQRLRLAATNDLILAGDPINEAIQLSGGGGADSGADLASLAQTQRSSSVSANCQDDDKVFPCDHTTPFRTITGWCNNLNNPKFGQSFTQLDRMLPNAYEDGLSMPRRFSSAALAPADRSLRLPLPSARLISTTIHDDKSSLHPRYSLALMQFGQFGVDHDLTRTPFSVAMDGTLLDCSSCDSRRTVHRDCYPIEIPDTDPHYHPSSSGSSSPDAAGSRAAPKCLHFVRSLNGQTGLGPRQQINALTAYFDGSHIYGSDNCEAKSLRAFQGGRLNSSTYPAAAAAATTTTTTTTPNQQQLAYVAREILPVTRANPECVTPSGLCFHAGDQRASEQPGLTASHIVFMRLHNSIVGQLGAINRHWPDEKLYQHGRRIVSAISQRIAYGEFAPRLLGLDYMSKFDLILKQVGYATDYDDSCSASILTEFAAAAFRMGHTLIRGAFPLLNRQYKPVGKAFQLRKAFFNSHRILTEPTLVDSILRGIVSTPIESFDNSISEELTNHLFEKPKEPFSGMDLISLNIQRARDHGVQSYNQLRAKCNLTRAKTFDDLAAEIPAKIIKRLAAVYASVDDIDLFTGGVSETSVHGGVVGPTFACIIGTQFQRLKKCDRFWHETSDPFIRFSAPQLAEIRKMTLAKVLCSQSDTIDTIQRNAMDVSDHYLNPRVPCSSLPSMDFSVWRENLKSCLVNKIKIDLGQSKRVNPCKSCTCTTEGPVCRTVKINCLHLMKQSINNSNFLSQIMADKSCLVQCAWALDMPLV